MLAVLVAENFVIVKISALWPIVFYSTWLSKDVFFLTGFSTARYLLPSILAEVRAYNHVKILDKVPKNQYLLLLVSGLF